MRKTTQLLSQDGVAAEIRIFRIEIEILLLEPTCLLRISVLIVLQYVDIGNLFLYKILLGRLNQGGWHRHATDIGEIGRHLVNPSLHENKTAVPYYRKCVTLWTDFV